MPPLHLLCAAAALHVAALISFAGAAAADSITVRDPNESGTINDTSRLRVTHVYNDDGRRGRIIVRARVGNVLLQDRFDLWLDTPGGRTTPEYFARIRPETEYGPVRHVRGWETTGRAACTRWEARSLAGRDQTVTFNIPRSCLDNPKRVRVALRSVYQYNQGRSRDWVPAARTFTRWVNVSTP